MSPKYDLLVTGRGLIHVTCSDCHLACVAGSCLLICPENLPL